ncbi:HNH endonuclease [Bacillus toyonensis]|uniref:HNH endonuclease n=1 Tax=Bacillus toyonensis TaxID=155322 RepID=UPI00217579A7|nr:HNH endonuclease [Bacillus toyonensis]
MNEEKEYCIYKDEEIDVSKGSLEHIIPLSLGGADDFNITVDRDMNSIAGSSIDGKLSNDFLVKLNNIKMGYKGHSKKEPILKIKKANIEGSPVSVQFKKEGMEVFDPIKKKIVKEASKVNLETKIELDTRIKFVCKVILAAGYFVYGDTFVKYADHDSLRKAAFSKDLFNEDAHDLRVYDNLIPIEDKDKGSNQLIKVLAENLGGSCVIFELSNVNIIGHVSIGGKYIGSVNFKAKSDMFPNDKEFRLGKVLCCKDNKLYGDSFWDTIYKMNKALGIVDIDDSQIEF